MEQICQKNLCTGCGACAARCPTHAIHMTANDEGFLYPLICNEQCIECGSCKKHCAVITKQPENHNCSFFAVQAKEPMLRKKSTSGGLFGILANYVLGCGGVVFGAALSADCRKTEHVFVSERAELSCLHTAKYMQSRVGGTYLLAEQYLKQDKLVLFTGTPCQIAGIKAFLGREYDNLLTADVVCHGAPSERVWDLYLDELENKYKSTVTEVNFRDKQYGWKNYGMQIRFSSGKTIWLGQRENAFQRGFIANVFLRRSCENCLWKGDSACSDITLGDFWGIQHVLPSWGQDDLGTSLAVIRTKKGQAFFDKVRCDLRVQQVDSESALRFNQAAVHPVCASEKRSEFFESLHSSTVTNLINAMYPLSMKEKLKELIPNPIKYKLKKLMLR